MEKFPSRYVRKLDEEATDFFSNLFEIVSIDEKKGLLLIHEFDCFDDDQEWIEEAEFFSSPFTFVLEEDVDKEKALREERNREAVKAWAKERGEKWQAEEKEREAHFMTLQPKYPRNLRVTLKKGYPREVLDFSRKEDVFYLDDVEKTPTGFAYFLRVVGERKHRGIYVFRTERSIGEEFIESAPTDEDPLDYDYAYHDETFGIQRKDR